MAKAVPLTLDALKAPQITPQAATPARGAPPSVKAEEPPAPAKEPQVPLQIRIPKDAARAIKVAAAERDLTISEFMLACFDAFMRTDAAKR